MKLQINRHSWFFNPGFLLLFLLFCGITLVAFIFFIRFLFTPCTGLVDNYPEAIYCRTAQNSNATPTGNDNRPTGLLIFSPRAFVSPAVAAGLIPGQDALAAVNGHPVRSTRDLVAAAYSIKGYTPFPVTVIRQGDGTHTFQITPQFNLMRADWLFMFLLSLVLGFASFYILFHVRGSSSYQLLACAGVLYLLVVNVKPFFYENTLSIALIHTGTFAPWLLVLFSLYSPRPKGKKIIRAGIISVILSGYAIFAVFRIVAVHQWCVTGDEVWYMQFRSMGKYNNIANGIAYLAFILLLWHSYRIAPGIKDRNQYQWLIVGFIISLSLYYCIEELPFILGEVPGERFGAGNLSLLFLIPVPLFFLIGYIRNRKIPIKSIQLGFILHFLLLVFIFFFFFVMYNPIKSYLAGNNGLTDDLASFSAMLILFVLLFPVYLVVNRLLRPLFYGKDYRNSLDYAVHLETVNEELKGRLENLRLANTARFQAAKIAEFRQLVKGLSARVKRCGFNIKKGLVILKGFDYTWLRGVDSGQEYCDDYKIFTGAVASVQRGYLGAKNFFERVDALLINNPQVCCAVDPAFIIRKAVHICTRKYPDLAPELDFRTGRKLYGCPDEIIFALSALLFNAYEARPGAGARVRVKLSGEGGMVTVEVADEGTGIPAVSRKRIYAPFYSTKAGHDGLGLYLARIFIEKNSGSLVCRNREANGCVFTVTLAG